MGHTSKKGEGCLNKTFVFKVKCGKDDIISLWKPAMVEYAMYWNKLSKHLSEKLGSMKIGDLLPYLEKYSTRIDTKTGTYPVNGYYQACEKHKDKPLYKMFKKGFNKEDAHNALYAYIKKVNPEGYNGNMLKLSDTSYRKLGYVDSVISNYRTKMTTLKCNIKYKKIDVNNVDVETLKRQTMFDVMKYNIDSVSDFKSLIDTLKSREENPSLIEKIARLELLYKYYKDNQESIKQNMEFYAIEELTKFEGCKRNSITSMKIYQQDSIMEKDGLSNFKLKLFFFKKPYIIPMYGNRQVVQVKNGERFDVVDITKTHGVSIIFKLENNELFVCLTSPVYFKKDIVNIANAVGVDVNTKHMLLATSILDDTMVKGYVNIYKELINDTEFLKSCNANEIQYYTQMAESVNFGLLETDSLYARYLKQTNVDKTLDKGIEQKLENGIKREKAIASVLENIKNKWNNIYITNYIDSIKMLRSKYKSYFVLKQKYYEKQQEFDTAQQYNDISTSNRETMDERRFTNPFINTDTAKGILTKLNNIEQDIKGCRDNIVTYAYNIFKNNGFDTIGLEYLDSSQFKQRRIPTPSPVSLLKFHKLEGKTMIETESFFSENKIKNDYYNFSYDNTGRLSNIEWNNKGLAYKGKVRFENTIIKAIHFADIKNKFVQLSNNDIMNIVFVPAAFTSQMDSITHTLYFVESKSKKKNRNKTFVLADKWSVRTKQETHINGLNSDYNSACNIRYLATNPTFREEMCVLWEPSRETPFMYNIPVWNIKEKYKKNVSAATLKTIRDFGNVRYGKIENGIFTEAQFIQ